MNIEELLSHAHVYLDGIRCSIAKDKCRLRADKLLLADTDFDAGACFEKAPRRVLVNCGE